MSDIPGQLHHDSEFQRASNTLDAVHAPRNPDLARRVDLLAEQRDSARRFAAAVEAQNALVLALHRPSRFQRDGRWVSWCWTCAVTYPCPTARIVLPDTDQPADGVA